MAFPVCQEPFQPAYGHRLIFHSHNTLIFTLFFLGTDPAAYGWQDVFLLEPVYAIPEFILCNELNEARDVNFHPDNLQCSGVFYTSGNVVPPGWLPRESIHRGTSS